MPTFYIEVITPVSTFRSERIEDLDPDSAFQNIATVNRERNCMTFTGGDGSYVLIPGTVLEQSVVVVREATP